MEISTLDLPTSLGGLTMTMVQPCLPYFPLGDSVLKVFRLSGCLLQFQNMLCNGLQGFQQRNGVAIILHWQQSWHSQKA
ncbi:carbon catabolite repressor protein 4-like protein 6 [Gossypium australe]|uniref:Carbon catabolite repressor protein 4-like protein 6 n=1 Tax=Gossypium australe TaxID=47621 RepID=A0A5B6VN44_9ROSI|nr:carbon catabolite repressor protein 4-like protein 6 [Gossypium australe]